MMIELLFCLLLQEPYSTRIIDGTTASGKVEEWHLGTMKEESRIWTMVKYKNGQWIRVPVINGIVPVIENRKGMVVYRFDIGKPIEEVEVSNIKAYVEKSGLKETPLSALNEPPALEIPKMAPLPTRDHSILEGKRNPSDIQDPETRIIIKYKER